ncbi:ABC transporter ATP-binding protein [Candidatus Aerophobetes bacterium]|nr:ABC transporter ATP-binding protein [Candidatus Aerophobetes bacterium]
MDTLLDVEKLKTNFYTYEGVVKALDGVSFKVEKGDTVGLVGETGCGKSVTSLSIMRLILPPGRIESGRVIFQTEKSGKGGYVDLLMQDENFMQKIRGNEISMIFQEPGSALNPVYTVGDQVAESFLLHRKKELLKMALDEIEEELKKKKNPFYRLALSLEKKVCKRELENPQKLSLKFIRILPFCGRYKKRINRIAINLAARLLGKMGIPDPERVVKRYPHQLSGGMQQRVVIAIALACQPQLLIADEPTSNLDVTIQAQILELINSLKKKTGFSILFISHDLGVISQVCRWVAVMYAGSICEIAKVKDLFENPLHPYTKALLKSIPTGEKKKLESIEGAVPNLVNPPSGCRFHPRCELAREKCKKIKPQLQKEGEEHFIACHFYKNQE